MGPASGCADPSEAGDCACVSNGVLDLASNSPIEYVEALPDGRGAAVDTYVFVRLAVAVLTNNDEPRRPRPSLCFARPEFESLTDAHVADALRRGPVDRLSAADDPVVQDVLRILADHTRRLSFGRGVWHPLPQNAVERAALVLFAEELKRRISLAARAEEKPPQ